MDKTQESSTFWKRSSFTIPGRAKKSDDERQNQQTCPNSFTIYEKSVQDAWCIDESNSRENLIRAHILAKNSEKDLNSMLNRHKNIFKKCRNIEELRKASWNGIPPELRANTWKILCNYAPYNLSEKDSILSFKRKLYWELVDKYLEEKSSLAHKDTFHQIHIDVPRMNPYVEIFQNTMVQDMFERILFVWALEHPLSGYVQGINDLVTPFFLVFARQYNSKNGYISLEHMSQEELRALEADIFWCVTAFLSGIQDNYTLHQNGIQSKIKKMRDLVERMDETLLKHLNSNEVDFVQFAFRWFNNLLTRELSIKCIIRLWDTYLAEGDEFPSFLPYVCAAFLLYWRSHLLELQDFQGLMVFLQNLPTRNWSDAQISLIVAEAYRLKVMFEDSPKHLEKY